MRKIKFRIWDNLTNEMYYDALVGNCRGESTVPCVYLNDVGWAHTDNCVVEQFTGLLDKNGKEIYEGDIVNCTDGADEINELDSDTGIGVVEWLDIWGFWNISHIENGLSDIRHNGYVEVIGNIHDNKEPLEQFRTKAKRCE